MFLNKKKCEPVSVSVSQHTGNSSVGLVIKTGLGMSIVFSTICSIQYAQSEKHFRSHAVNQPRCHSEHRQDKITQISKSARQCKSCGQQQSQSAFASKGRGRTSAFCRDCDNKRRRAAHAPIVKVRSWDHPTIRFESTEVGSDQLASLLWELLSDPSSSNSQPVEQTIESLLNRRSSINDFVNEV